MLRLDAIIQGLPHYDGRPCVRCSSTKKFVSSYACVACTTERTKRRDPAVFKKYIKSEKGQTWQKEFRHSDSHKRAQSKWNKKVYKRDPSKARNAKLMQRYGMTLEQYDAMVEQQNGCCHICNTHQDELTKRLAADHCHESLKIGKLLCTNCNVALGMVKDSVDILSSMIDYINEHRGISNEPSLDHV